MNTVNDYISERFDRWKDYAKFQAARAGIPDDASDILNEVMLSLLQKDPQDLNRMLAGKKRSFSKRDQVYTELDYFVLRMIQLNSHSMTSPWRHKSKMLDLDANIDLGPSNFGFRDPEDDNLDEIPFMEPHRPLEGEFDDPDQEGDPDPVEEELQQWAMVRETLDSLPVPAVEKQIFSWKFFGDKSLRSWPGKESYQVTCGTYNRICKQVREVLSGGGNSSPSNPDQLAPVATEEEKLRILAVRLTKLAIHQRNERIRKLSFRLVKASIRLKKAA